MPVFRLTTTVCKPHASPVPVLGNCACVAQAQFPHTLQRTYLVSGNGGWSVKVVVPGRGHTHLESQRGAILLGDIADETTASIALPEGSDVGRDDDHTQ